MGFKDKLKSTLEEGRIQEHLRLWAQHVDTGGQTFKSLPLDRSRYYKGTQNLLTQSSEDESFNSVAQEEADAVEDHEHLEFGSDDPAIDVLKNELFLRKGDLVELK